MIWDTFAFDLDDMRYLCFWRSGERISTLQSAISSWVICTPGIWYHLWGRRKNWVFRKALLGVRPQRWERVGHGSSGLPCHKRRRSTYIEIISSGGTVFLPLSTNVLIPQIRLFEIVAPLRFLNNAPSISEQAPLRFLNDAPLLSERVPFDLWTTRSSALRSLNDT